MIDYDSLWFTMKSKKPVKFLYNKSRKISTEVITALSFLGNATATDISMFMLKERSGSQKMPTRSAIRELRGIIKNRFRKRSEKNPGLVDQGFILETGISDTKNNPPIYALTFRGCFLVLGFNINDGHLRKFISKSAKHSLVFAYIHSVTQETSLGLTKKIFINPMRELIGKGMVPLDDDFKLSVPTISAHCGNIFQNFIEKNLNNKTVNDIGKIHELSLSEEPDWYQEAIDRFFPEDDERKDYLQTYHDDDDMRLCFNLQRSIISAHDAVIR